jgi:hypothetical protein
VVEKTRRNQGRFIHITVSRDVIYVKGFVMVTRRRDTKWCQYLSFRKRLCDRVEVIYEKFWGHDTVTGRPFKRAKRITIINNKK